MQYLNLPISLLNSVEFVGSEPVDQATWIKLLGYCADQENGGTITGCRGWKDRKCQQILRITSLEMLRGCDLWSWTGDDLIVFGYPAEQEQTVRAKREIARANGASSRGRPRAPAKTDTGSHPAPTPEPAPPPKSEPVSEPDPLAVIAQRIVDTYPRREGLADALAIVHAHLREGGPELANQILHGTKAAALAIAQAPSGSLNKYVPSAVTFFRGKRWMDDPATLLRGPDPAKGKPTLTPEEKQARLGGRATEDAA